jgi:glycosyltransferase involved in cell wall biosynthesis
MLRHGYGIPPARVHVVPPAITPDRVEPAVRPLRHRGRPLLGRVCRLAPEKGVDGFLRALALVREQRPDVAGIVVGDGPCARELHDLRRALGLEAAVDLLGHRPDARALIGSLDVMALTSHSEGSPLVVSEALAAGVPVVATAGGAGLLVRPGDPAALAAALLAVLDDPACAARLRTAARERARETSHPRMVDALRTLYARVARPARTRAGA